MSGNAIRIDGLNEFVRNLRRVDSTMPTMVRLALNESADLVLGVARPRVPSRSGRARGSMRARSTATAARVMAGGARAKHYPWLDFGGRVGRGGSVSRPFFKHGRYIYDAYFRLRASGEFVDVMTANLLDVIRSAGIEVD